MKIELPYPPKELSPNATLHWAKKMKFKKSYRQTCWALALSQKLTAPPGEGKIDIHITFYPPDRRHRDADNMVASIKAGLDGVADALKVNDKRFLPTFKFSDEPLGKIVVEIKWRCRSNVASSRFGGLRTPPFFYSPESKRIWIIPSSISCLARCRSIISCLRCSGESFVSFTSPVLRIWRLMSRRATSMPVT